MAADKTTFGVTPPNATYLEELSQTQYFTDQMEAAKFALSLAIRSGEVPGTVSGTDTKWHFGSFDKDGKLRAMIQTLFPDVEAPYRAIEHLLNVGLDTMRGHILENGELDLLALIEPSEAAGAGE